MPPVIVVNEDVEKYEEQYNGELITIPARGSIEMDRQDAIEFFGSYTPTARKINGVMKRQVKALRKYCPFCAETTPSGQVIYKVADPPATHECYIQRGFGQALKIHCRCGIPFAGTDAEKQLNAHMITMHGESYRIVGGAGSDEGQNDKIAKLEAKVELMTQLLLEKQVESEESEPKRGGRPRKGE